MGLGTQSQNVGMMMISPLWPVVLAPPCCSIRVAPHPSITHNNDYQSNSTLAHPEFFELFGIKGGLLTYHIRMSFSLIQMLGRKAVGFQSEPVGGGPCLDFPPLIECDEIAFNRALAHPHLKHLAHLIPNYDPDVQIAVLLGRDIIQVHKAQKQINRPPTVPLLSVCT